MFSLLNGAGGFLRDEHYLSAPEHYTRNAIYVDPQGTFSLYALVWRPQQWTPIHDHGTWGVVGVVDGLLQETAHMRTDTNGADAVSNIALARGGVLMLTPGAVTSFVPSPDHIHQTGNATNANVVSLHLNGNAMADFHIYDAQAHTREWLEVTHQ